MSTPIERADGHEPLDDAPATKGAEVAPAGMVIARHGALYLLARAAQMLAFIVVLPAVTRLLDPEQYGVVAVALVVNQALLALGSLGLTSVAAFDLYERREDGLHLSKRMVMAATVLASGMTLIALLTGPWWSRLFSGLQFGWPLVVACLLCVPLTFQAGTLSVLQAQGRPGAFVTSTVISTAGGQLLGLALLAVDPSPTAYLVGVLAGATLGALSAALSLRHVLVLPAPWASIRAGIRHGGPTVPHLLGFMVLAVGDRVIIERVLGLTEAARYQTAYTIGALGMSLLFAVNQAWVPMVYGAKGDGAWEVLTDTTVRIAWFGAGVVAGIALAAPLALRVMAPPEYEPLSLSPVVVWVVASVMPNVTYLAGVHVLFKKRRTAALLVIMPLAALVNVGANIVLVRTNGLVGAGVATLAGYVVTGVAARVAARRVARVRWDHWRESVAYIAAAVAVVVALVLPVEGPAMLVRLVIAVAAAVAAVVPFLRSPAGGQLREATGL